MSFDGLLQIEDCCVMWRYLKQCKESVIEAIDVIALWNISIINYTNVLPPLQASATLLDLKIMLWLALAQLRSAI